MAEVAAFAAALALYLTAQSPVETSLIVPLFKDVALEMGVGFILLTWFVIAGSSNAVNLTDGLDGLAILPSVLVAGGLGVSPTSPATLFFPGTSVFLLLPARGRCWFFALRWLGRD